LGYGATSVVYKAIETTDNHRTKTVAIKALQNIFESNIYAHRILREMKLMRILRGHQNIVKLKQIMRPADPENFTSLNFVMEHCS
jgi:serine/threonine protein kinase